MALQTEATHTSPSSVNLKKDASLVNSYAKELQVEEAALHEPQDKKGLVAVVDPWSTGAVLAQDYHDRGYAVIRVFSDKAEKFEKLIGMVPEHVTLEYVADVANDSTNEELVKKIEEVSERMDLPIVAVTPGCESGVLVAEKIADTMGLPGNDMKHSLARRDKYLMHEAIRAAGVRAAGQCRATSWEQVSEWMDGMGEGVPVY